MTRSISSIPGAVALAAAATLLAADPGAAAAETRSSRTFEESFAPSDGPFEALVVDNVHGSIEVRAHDRDTVEMSVTETIIARTERAAERAREEVRLETSGRDGVVDLFVDGPFRDSRDRERWSDRRDPGYRVVYDFVLRVPRRLDIDLRTVTDGEIDVAGVEGSFHLRNVNGGVRLLESAGAGTLETVNGGIVASFLVAPRDEIEAHTINGDIELAFPPDLAADVQFKSMNGEMRVAARERGGWDLTAVPPQVRVEDRHDGTRYRLDRWSTWRIGAGGPTLRLETLNGDVILTATD
ncbi:MAG TPA: hypothetical protein VMT85_14640 [Thermoanaerobaculia bacterium]|nr:hypothetical protein [Thermoanaerobaculia bacterium]